MIQLFFNCCTAEETEGLYRTVKEDKTLHTHCTSSGALDVIYRGLDVVQDNMSDIHHFHQHPTL